MSQPSMSRAINQLRAVTGDRILVKGGGRLIPTAKAAQMRDAAERILEEVRELLGTSAEFDPRSSKYLFRIIATDYVESLCMGMLLKYLSGPHSGISVSLRNPVHPLQYLKLLEDGEVDFCIGILPPSLREQHHRLLLRDRIVCVARAGHRVIGRELTSAQFANLDHGVIVPNTIVSFGDAVDLALSADGLRRNRRVVTPNYLSVLHLVERTDMVALLPLSLANRFAGRFGLVQVALPMKVPEIEIYISWHERTHRQAAHVWFREQVQSLLEDGSNLPIA